VFSAIFVGSEVRAVKRGDATAPDTAIAVVDEEDEEGPPAERGRSELEAAYPSLTAYPHVERGLLIGLREADPREVMRGLALALAEPVALGFVAPSSPFIDPGAPASEALSPTAIWLEAARLMYAPDLPATALYPEPATASARDVSQWIERQSEIVSAPLMDAQAGRALVTDLTGPHLCAIVAPGLDAIVEPHVVVALGSQRGARLFVLEADPQDGVAFRKRKLPQLARHVGAMRGVAPEALELRCAGLLHPLWGGGAERLEIAPSLDAWLRDPGVDTPLPREIAELAADVDIEDPTSALEGFRRKLVEREAGTRDRVRITHYGDSAIVNDGITAYARRAAQRRFGDGGHGIVLLARPKAWNHRDVTISDVGWTVSTVVRDDAPGDRFGVAGAVAEGWAGARTAVGTPKKETGFGMTATQYRVLLEGSPIGGTVTWGFRGHPDEEIDTRREELSTVVGRIAVPSDLVGRAHKLRLRVTHGRVRGYVVSAEADTGIIYDSAGLISSRAERLARVDAEQFAEQLDILGTDLVVLQYGGNSVWFHKHQRKSWTRKFARLLAMIPSKDRACLVIGPVGGRDEFGPLGRDMREQAFAAGCAWWDTTAAMGGGNAMTRWRDSGLPLVHNPSHLKFKGGAVVAALLLRALLRVPSPAVGD
jgi:hypothetical protein